MLRARRVLFVLRARRVFVHRGGYVFDRQEVVSHMIDPVNELMRDGGAMDSVEAIMLTQGINFASMHSLSLS